MSILFESGGDKLSFVRSRECKRRSCLGSRGRRDRGALGEGDHPLAIKFISD